MKNIFLFILCLPIYVMAGNSITITSPTQQSGVTPTPTHQFNADINIRGVFTIDSGDHLDSILATWGDNPTYPLSFTSDSFYGVLPLQPSGTHTLKIKAVFSSMDKYEVINDSVLYISVTKYRASVYTDVNDIDETSNRLYPNPSTGDVFSKMATKYALYNATGELLKEGMLGALKPLTITSRGVYFVRTDNNTQTILIK